MDSGALNNPDMITMVLDHLENGDAFQNVNEFLAALEQNSQVLEIHPVVRDIMMNQTFAIISLHFTEFLRGDWISWFTVKLIPLLPSITAEMLQRATSDGNCIAFHAIVEGLSSVFDQMSLERQQELTLVLVDHLKHMSESGSTCGSDTSSLSAWLDVNFGKYSVYVAFQDLLLLNTNFSNFEELDSLSASQVAKLTVDSGALNNPYMITMVFDYLENGDALQNVNGFLAGLTQNSQALEIHPVVRDMMMNRTFAIISLHLTEFLREDWVSWFTVQLIPLLPSITAEMLQTATTYGDCITFHAIVEGLSSVFDQMSLERQQELTIVLVDHLKHTGGSGSTCGSDTSSLRAWLDMNFGKFSVYVVFQDLLLLNANFSNFEALDLLSASQVAQLTVNSEALNNPDMITMVFDHLENGNAFQNVNDFLAGLTQNSQTLEIHPVVRDVMMIRTFAIISLHFTQFLRVDWVSWFTVKLIPLLPSITAEMLQTATSDGDCLAFHTIVEGLSIVFDQMSLERQQELTLVLVDHLKHPGRSSSTCGTDTSSLSAWLDVNFGKFSVYVAFQNLLLLNANFFNVEALDSLSASQVAKLTVDSGGLNDPDKITMVFDHLDNGDAVQNVNDFLAGLTQISQVLEIHPVVRDIMMNRTFAIIRLHFTEFLRGDWVSWFTVKLIPLMPSITAEMLQTATSYGDCITFHTIVEGLSSVFDQMSLERQQELTLVLVDHLKHTSGSGSTCGSDTSSLRAWLDVNFGKFSVYVAFQDLILLNANFSNFEALDLLSASQVAQLTVNSGALNNPDMITRVFDHLENADAFQNMNDFLAGLAQNSQALEIHPVVRDIMMNRTFAIISLHFTQFLRVDWISWFTVKLIPLLPSITAEMLQTATADSDCIAFHAIVQGLSSVFDQISLERQQEVTLVMVDHLKHTGESGSTCGSDTSSLRAWLDENFGKFSVYVAFQDLLLLNVNFSKFEALDSLSASQVAKLTVDSGALNNPDMITMVFDHLENGDAFENMNDFLAGLTQISQALEIHPVVRGMMMNRTFSIISLHFTEFLRGDWVSWFTVKLIPLLPSITAEMLQTATSYSDCIAFHTIVEGLSRVIDQMSLERQQELTIILVDHLKHSGGSGSACGSDTSSLRVWLDMNFGKFSVYVAFQDLLLLNGNFSNFEALDLLSASQVVQLTVNSGALNNPHMITMVFDHLENGNAFQNVNDFLAGLTQNSQALEIHPVVRDVMMNRTFAIIRLHFTQFLRVDWVSWFTLKLIPLLPSITAEMLQTATSDGDCIAFHAIVEGLSIVFDQMSLERQQELTLVLVDHLKHPSRSGSTCGSDTSSLSAWLDVNFGKFSVYVAFQDLLLLNANFFNFEALDSLSASQVVKLTVDSGALNNPDMITMVFDHLENGNAFQNVNDFLAGLTQNSQTLEIHPVVRDTMMNRTFAIVSLHFTKFMRGDWVSWFTVNLIPLLPSITAEMLQKATSYDDCIAFQAIIEGLSSVFDQMSLERQQELTIVLVDHRKQTSGSGSTCGLDTSSLRAWLDMNFGKFSVYVAFQDLLLLNANFSNFEALDLLSASQVAQLTVNSGALNNPHMITMVFDYLENADAFQNVNDFLAGLAQNSQALEIHPVVRDIMMNRTFAIISLHFTHFLRVDWVSWFTVKLIPLLPSITAEMLQTATSDGDCIAFRTIVGGLSSVFDQMSLERQQELTLVLVDHLKHTGRSGSTCGSDTSSLRAWLDVNFGKFSVYVAFQDLLLLNVNFVNFETLDFLSASQVAKLTVDSGALNNPDMITMVFDHLENGDAFQNMNDFLAGLTQNSQVLEIHPVVRDIMMNRTFAIISLHFTEILRGDWVSWFTVKLIPLLPSITAEMLQTATSYSDCNAFQAIVEGLSSIFDQMSLEKQQDLSFVLVDHLKHTGGSGSTCGSDTSSLRAWLDVNFGKFSVYVAFQDLLLLNANFSNFEALDLLSASQVAQLTVNSGALNNPDMITMVFDHLENANAFQNVNNFLAGLTQNSQALEIHPVVRDIMMNRTFAIISLHFTQFLRVDWVSWFTVKLIPLLPSINAEMLQTATSYGDCIAFHAIVEALSSVFDQMSLERQQELTLVLVDHLKHPGRSGSTCGSDISSLSTWLDMNFGKFSVYVAFQDLLLLNANFFNFEAMDFLSTSQVAQLTMNSGALNNPDMITMVFDHLENDDAFQNVNDFVAGLAQNSQALEIHPVVRDVMMNRTFAIISLHFTEFLREDWVSWFTVKLIPLLPSITAEMLQTSTSVGDCFAFHTIVEGLSSVFDQMSLKRQQELTLVLVDHLKHTGGSGSTCGSDTSSLSAWLDLNIGKFSVYVAFQDLLLLNANFSNFEALDSLSASQVGKLTVDSGALNNPDMITMVFDHLENGDAFQNVNDFLAGLTQNLQVLEIHPVVRNIMMNRTFSIITLHFTEFLREDWVSWFTEKLIPLLPSITAEMLQTATSYGDCNAFHAIVEGLSSVFEQMSLERQQEHTIVLVDHLKHTTGSGSTCGSDTSSLRAWLDVNFGKFSVYVAFQDLLLLNANFSNFEALDFLSAFQAVQLTVKSGALNNPDMITMVFDRLENGDAFQNVNDYLAGLTQNSQALEIHPVVRNIMMNRTFAIISLHFTQFLRVDWVSWFTEKLIPLLPSITAEMLQTATSDSDCITFHTIVEGISSVIDQMSLERQQELTLVLVDHLKHPGRSGSTCGSDTSSLSAWLDVNFGKFSVYVAFQDLLLLNANFFNFEALDSLGASQVAKLLVESGGLNNPDMITMVFDHLENGDAFQYVNDFLAGLTQNSQALEIHPVVRDIMMNRTFAIISLHFTEFLREDWVSWFTVKLILLLPSITPEMLQTATSYGDCIAFHTIVEGLSSVCDQMSLERQQELTLVLVDQLKQISGSGSTCGSDTSSLRAWLVVNFGNFSVYVAFQDLLLLNANFSNFEALDLLSASQVAQLTVNSGALNNPDMITMVFDHLENGNAFQNVNDFLAGLTKNSQTLEIHPVVRDILMNRTFAIISLHFTQFLREDWVSWFTVKLIPLLPSITAEMLQRATSDGDCIAFHAIVEGLSSIFDQMSLERQQELTLILVDHLKHTDESGSTCGSDTSSLSAWLDVNFGKFSVYVAFQDLLLLNANFSKFEALDSLSASQVAKVTVDSGALTNPDMITMVFDHLENGNAFQNMNDFLTGLTQNSQVLEIHPVVRDIMMNRTFSIISLHFTEFLREDWVSWFKVKLIPLLPSITAEMLQTATSYGDCITFHAIVEGLSSVIDQMSLERQQELTIVLTDHLKHAGRSGSTCGSDTSSLRAWLDVNFGNFSVYVAFQDLLLLNANFSNFEALDLLSASQVAQLTVNSGALNNPDMITMVFDHLENGNAFQNVNDFLSGLAQNSQALEIHLVVRDIMMNRTFAIIRLHFTQFLREDWVSWFTVKLIPLLPSITAEMLQTATSVGDCIAFHAIVEGLNNVFDQMSLERQQELTLVLVDHLKRSGRSGSTCGSDTSSLSAWLDVNFGKFSVYVAFQNLLLVNANFSNFEALDSLSASQVAKLTVDSGALNNPEMITMVFDHLENGDAFQNVNDYLAGLTQNSQALKIHPVVRDIMMNQTFAIISLHFTEFLGGDWVSWFTVKMIPLLPSITAEMLQKATSYGDCIAFHAIVEGLSSVFNQMSLERQQELTIVLVDHLKNTGGSGSTCGSDTSSLRAWLDVNFGKFSVYVAFQDLLLFNANFSNFEALDLLSAFQVAQLTVNSGALNNPDMITMVFDHLENIDAFQNVNDFLTGLAQNSQTLEIHPVVRDIMMNRTFAIISLHFTQFLRVDWVSWFTVKLIPLLPSITAEMLQKATSDGDCIAFHAIVEGLSSVYEKMSLERQQELTIVLVDHLKHTGGSDSTCGSDTSSLRAWFEVNFGKFSVYVAFQDLLLLNKNFFNFEALDSLSASEVAKLTVDSGALNNPNMITMVFDHLENGDAFQNINYFLADLTQNSLTLEIHPVVRDIMMTRTFAIISLHFTEFLRGEWVSWFTLKMIPLLPSITAEMLQTATSYSDCITFQAIVEGLSSVFDQMSLERQQELTIVLVDHLKHTSGSGSTCESDTSSLRAWLDVNFGKFSVYVAFQDLLLLNANFSNFEALDLLSASQVAQLTVNSGALNNPDMITMVFDHLENGDAFQNVNDFLAGLSQNSEPLEIHPVVRDIMMNQTFVIISLHFTEFLRVDWVSWFTVKLVPLLPSITAEMLQTATSDGDCIAFHAIVEGLSRVYDRMSLERQQELTFVLVDHLKHTSGSGSTCGSDISSLNAWLDVNFGKFSGYVAFQDLLLLNANFWHFNALDSLSASQVAELTVDSGALNNPDMITMVFDHLENGDAFQNVKNFLAALAQNSQALEIHPVVRDVMMNRTFAIISLHFTQFLRVDWVSWFTVKLIPLLPSITAEMLQRATSDNNCIAYHAIVEGLSTIFDQISLERQQELTLVLVDHLKHTDRPGSTCGSDTSSLSAWLDVNFGKFSVYVAFQDLLLLNANFSNFNALDSLSASQVAELTVDSGALNNPDMITMVFDNLENGDAFQNVNDFLAGFTQNSQALKIHPVVRDMMMNRTFAIISLHFTEFLREEWVSWFNGQLIPLLPSITAEMFQKATSYGDCIAFHAIVEGLSRVIDEMSLKRQQELTIVLVDHLKHTGGSGSTCGSDTSSLRDWLDVNFGKFSVYVAFQDLLLLNANFSNFEALDFLSASQVAHFTVNSEALNNPDMITMVFDHLENGDAFQNVNDFLAGLTQNPQALKIHPVVRDIMMNRTFAIISLHFTEYVRVDWISWFTVKLIPVLPSITAEMLQTATSYSDCIAFHTIVEGLSSVFDLMSLERQQELTLVLVDHLKHPGRAGSTCGSDTSSLSAWLDVNFGKFSVYIAYQDLLLLNANFFNFEALDSLNASQVAKVMVDYGGLNNPHMITMVFDHLENGNAFQNVNDFLAGLTQNSQALEIHPVVRDIMMNRTFAIISLHFTEFLREDWVSWFTVKLIPLLPSMTAEMLQTATSDGDCIAFYAIVEGLSSIIHQMSLERQQELTIVLVDHLKHTSESGSTCGSDTSSLRAWLDVNFGKFSVYVAFQDLLLLNANFSKFEALDLLSASQVAQLTVNSGALHNPDMITMVFDHLKNGDAFQNVNDFLAGLAKNSQALEIHPVVRDFMMNRTFAIISLHFTQFLREDWVSWFTVKLIPLLPSINAEMLQTATSDRNCIAFQAIVEGLSSVFGQMSLERQQELTLVLVDYLKHIGGSGSTCGSDTSSLSAWLDVNFGKFSVHVAFQDLLLLNPNFSNFEALDSLSASQVAKLTVDSGALNNLDMITMVFDHLENGNAFQNVNVFLAGLTQNSQALAIHPVVRDIMMNRTFAIISLHFTQFLREDWVSWFTVKLIPLLPSITAEMLQTATSYSNCITFHAIVEGLSSVFDQMSLQRQQELTLVLVGYLKQSYRSGSTCGSETSSIIAWLDVNFGKFSVYVNFEDLQEREMKETVCQKMIYCQLCQLCSSQSTPLHITTLSSFTSG
nr:uncharacterized protein LOC129433983 [Misgurnus anguillicaudatus]